MPAAWPRPASLSFSVARALAAWRTSLLGLDCGEQPLPGALRPRPARLVQMKCLCKLFAHEVRAPREFGMASKCSLDEAASRRLSVPAACHGNSRSISWRFRLLLIML